MKEYWAIKKDIENLRDDIRHYVLDLYCFLAWVCVLGPLMTILFIVILFRLH